jgi:hypothetical protein
MIFPRRFRFFLRSALILIAAGPATRAGDTATVPFGITTLTPPRIDLNPGPAYWARMRLWQGIPSVERAPQGRLWVTWYTGGVGEGKGQNHQLLVTSGDDGLTWSKPVAVFDPGRQLLGGEGGDPHLWIDPNGKLWWFVHRVMASPGLYPRTCWGFYTDEPDQPRPTWKGPVFAGYGYALNKEVVLADGTWLHMSDPFARSDPAAAPEVAAGAHVYKFAGYDRPFEHVGYSTIRDTPFTEHMVVQRRDGTLWMLARTRYGIAQSLSTDGGRTWREQAEPFTRDFNVNVRFFFRKLTSGHLLFVGNHHPKKRANMTAMLSEDEGRTWPHKLVIDERDAVSYPDGTQAPDGSIYVTYDRGRYNFDQQEILIAKFSEADVRAGRITSAEGRLKQIVNKLKTEGGGVRHTGEANELTQEFQRLTALTEVR